MQYTKEFNIHSFPFWSGARDTMKDVVEADKVEELESYIEDVFAGGAPTETEVNDFVWFQRDDIFNALGIDEGCPRSGEGVSLDGIEEVGGEL